MNRYPLYVANNTSFLEDLCVFVIINHKLKEFLSKLDRKKKIIGKNPFAVNVICIEALNIIMWGWWNS